MIEDVSQIKKLMKEALKEAEKCLENGDVPVGCVIVDGDGNVVSRGHNTRVSLGKIHGHAEINAINELPPNAGKSVGELSLIVTLEPCPMCETALSDFGIKTVYYGAPNETNGACGTVWNLAKRSNIDVFGGFLFEECSELVKSFFQSKRN